MRFRRSTAALGRLAATALLVLVVAALAAPSPAGAGKGWCRFDPLVLLDGEPADIWVASTLDALVVTTGPIRIDVTVPVGTTTQLVLSDAGFGRGYDVRFVESAELARGEAGLPVRVAVYVPATDDVLPIRVEFAPRVVGILHPASAEGAANRWVVLDASL